MYEIFFFFNNHYLNRFLKGSGNFVLDPLEIILDFSLCCNDNYKPLGQLGTPWLLQADRLSDF